MAPKCLDAVARAKAVLVALGHEVIDTSPPDLKYDSFVDVIINVMATNVAVTVNGFLRQGVKSGWKTMLEPAMLDAYEIGKGLNAETYVLAMNRFHGIARQLETYLDGYDFVLSPTLPSFRSRWARSRCKMIFAPSARKRPNIRHSSPS